MKKVSVLLACVCVVAHAQFTNNRGQTSFGQSSFGSPRAQASSSARSSYQQNQYQQNQYQRNQYQEAPQPSVASGCREKNDRYPVSGSCDRYVECINGTAEEKLCPDGLRYNPNVNINVYPCQYPNEVPCLERSALQPAQPTESCPHQFGLFKLGDSKNCGEFRNCVNGIGFDQTCPEGLAFSSETYRCEWPDEVADCDAEAYLGFRCPDVPISKELGAPAGYRFYRSDTNCQKYFICIDGRPRALSCGGENGFDELTSTCLSADEVDACPVELKQAARKTREQEQQRLARELAIKQIPTQQRRRL